MWWINAEAIKECGAHFEGAISYTVSPVHTLDSFLEYGQQLKDLGADSIAIKDMAGMLTPYRTERIVKAFNAEIGLPIHVHATMLAAWHQLTSSNPLKQALPSLILQALRSRSATRIPQSR